MDQFGLDFHGTGSVMTPAQLQEHRLKRGECVTCGRKCFNKKLLRMIPITDHGRVLKGRCLNCDPLNSNDVSNLANRGIIPAFSRPATREDLARFSVSQSNLARGAGGPMGLIPPHSQAITRGALRPTVSSPLPAPTASVGSGGSGGTPSSGAISSTIQRPTSNAGSQRITGSTHSITVESSHLTQLQSGTRGLSARSNVSSGSADNSTGAEQEPGSSGASEQRRMSMSTTRPQKQPMHGNSSIRSTSRDSLISNEESITSHQRTPISAGLVIEEEPSLHQDLVDQPDYEYDVGGLVASPRTPVVRRKSSALEAFMSTENEEANTIILPHSAHLTPHRKDSPQHNPHYCGSDQDDASFVDDYHGHDLRPSYHSAASRGSGDSRSSRDHPSPHYDSPSSKGRHNPDDEESFTNASENYDNYAPLPEFHYPTGEEIEDAYDRITGQPYGAQPPPMLDHYHLNGRTPVEGNIIAAAGQYDSSPVGLLQSETSLGSTQSAQNNGSNSMSVRVLESSQRSLRSDRSSGHNTEDEMAAYESRIPKHGILNRGGAVNLVRMTNGHRDGSSVGNASMSIHSSSEHYVSSSHHESTIPYNSKHGIPPGAANGAANGAASNRSLDASVSSFEEEVVTVERQESMSSFPTQVRAARSNSNHSTGLDRSNSTAASIPEEQQQVTSSSDSCRYVGDQVGIGGSSFHSTEPVAHDSLHLSSHSVSGVGASMVGDMKVNSSSASLACDPQNSLSSNLSRSEEGLQRLSAAGSDYVQIIDVMYNYPNSAAVLSNSMQEISNLHLSPEDCDTLSSAGGIDAIIQAMRCFPEEAELQLCACRAICNISGTQRNQIALVDAGAAYLLLDSTMETFPNIPELQEQAMAALANLAALEANVENLIEWEIVPRVVQAMNRHGNDIQVQMKGCSVITNLASHPTPMKASVMMAGGGGAVVLSMVLHSSDPNLQEKGLQALRNLSANCEENKLELAHIGGIDASIDAMRKHRDDPYVQQAGAWTLCNLAGNMSNKQQIGELSGVDVVVRAMWVHSDQVAVDEWCVRALFSLSLHPANCRIILDVGGISAVVNAMQAHEKSSVVQEMGCAVLCNLANEENAKLRIVDEEALDAIVLAMVLFGEDVKVQERACQVLLQLAIAPNVTSLHASNVVELARVAAGKFPDNCGEPAQLLISALGEITPGYNTGQGIIPVS